MSTAPQRHPFLDDLADNVVLVSSILRQPVFGRSNVLKVVKAGASQYIKQVPKYLDTHVNRTYFDYDIALRDGLEGSGLVSIHRDSSGKVIALNITFSPLPVVVAMAAGVRDALAGDFDADLLMAEDAQ